MYELKAGYNQRNIFAVCLIRVADNFKDNPDVKFVFVNSWEHGTEKEKKVNKFIQEHHYTFQVLMDREDEVVKAYGVKGIPTKMVIDKSGNIRFESSGFGSDVRLVNELTAMIELVGRE